MSGGHYNHFWAKLADFQIETKESPERLILQKILDELVQVLKTVEYVDSGDKDFLSGEKEIQKFLRNLQAGHIMDRAMEQRLHEIEKEMRLIKAILNKKRK